MFQLSDDQKKWLKIIGVAFIVVGNVVMSILGFATGTGKLMSSQCEEWLLTHDEFTAPPQNCGQEIKYLKKRCDKEVKEHGF
jgi:hypothetical protein